MGTTASAEVTLKHDVYYPGNVVEGVATIKVTDVTKIVASRIRCVGVEEATATVVAPNFTQRHAGTTTFFEETLTLFGPVPGDPDVEQHTLQVGHYKYPFAFELPMHLPGSTRLWDAQAGVNIRYFVEARLKKTGDETHEFKHDFVVVVPINKKDLDRPGPTAHKKVSVSHFLHDHGSSELTLASKRRFFAGGGDKIEMDLTIDNTHCTMATDTVNIEVYARVDWALPEYQNESGAAFGDSLLKMRLGVEVPAGKKVTMPVVIPLPNTIHLPSYPAKGSHFYYRHEVSVKPHHANEAIVLPIHIAHSASADNAFEFIPNDKNCEVPLHRKPYVYTPWDGTKLHWEPPKGEPQPRPVAKTPAALDTLPVPLH